MSRPLRGVSHRADSEHYGRVPQFAGIRAHNPPTPFQLNMPMPLKTGLRRPHTNIWRHRLSVDVPVRGLIQQGLWQKSYAARLEQKKSPPGQRDKPGATLRLMKALKPAPNFFFFFFPSSRSWVKRVSNYLHHQLQLTVRHYRAGAGFLLNNEWTISAPSRRYPTLYGV